MNPITGIAQLVVAPSAPLPVSAPTGQGAPVIASVAVAVPSQPLGGNADQVTLAQAAQQREDEAVQQQKAQMANSGNGSTFAIYEVDGILVTRTTTRQNGIVKVTYDPPQVPQLNITA